MTLRDLVYQASGALAAFGGSLLAQGINPGIAVPCIVLGAVLAWAGCQ